MTILRLDELQPGMILAEDAVHLNGRILLRAGVALTEQHLRMFRMWGLIEAGVAEMDPERLHTARPEDADPEHVNILRASLNERFRFVDSAHPAIAELFRWCLEQKVQESIQ